MGVELDRFQLPQACSWVGMGGQRLSPGTWGAGISGMWQGSREWSSSPGLGGWVGPKFRHGALSSSGLFLSPGLPLTSALPRLLPVEDWAEGRGWVRSHFQVFPALGQPGSLTNQLLQG